jgi:hypothetical protein
VTTLQRIPRVVRLQALGAGTILVLMALNEYLDLPKLLFGEEPTPLRHHEFILESAAVIVVSLIAITLSWFSMSRCSELDRLLVMCSWCRKVRIGDRWMALETYLHEQEAVTATHGLCPTCYTKQASRLAS